VNSPYSLSTLKTPSRLEAVIVRFDSGLGSGPFCAKCLIITKNQFEEKERLEQERADEIRTLEFNKSELIDNITSHNNVIEEIKEQIKSENDKISLHIRSIARTDDTSLQTELKKLRIKEFEGMTADNFRAKDTIEKTLEIKSLEKKNKMALLLLALMLGGMMVWLHYWDDKLEDTRYGKIVLGIIAIWICTFIIVLVAFWFHEVRIKKKLREEPFPMRLVGRYIDWSFGTSELHVLKEKEESRILGKIKLIEEMKAETAQIPNIRSTIESLEKNIANNNEEIAEIKIKIINIDKQIIVARDSIKEMIPYSDRLELE